MRGVQLRGRRAAIGQLEAAVAACRPPGCGGDGTGAEPTMLKPLWTWLREERSSKPGSGRLAGWLGRGWARFHYATRVEPTWLELTHHAVPIADLPAAFHGFRLIQ